MKKGAPAGSASPFGRVGLGGLAPTDRQPLTGKFRRLIVPGRGDWFTTRPRSERRERTRPHVADRAVRPPDLRLRGAESQPEGPRDTGSGPEAEEAEAEAAAAAEAEEAEEAVAEAEVAAAVAEAAAEAAVAEAEAAVVGRRRRWAAEAVAEAEVVVAEAVVAGWRRRPTAV